MGGIALAEQWTVKAPAANFLQTSGFCYRTYIRATSLGTSIRPINGSCAKMPKRWVRKEGARRAKARHYCRAWFFAVCAENA